jgi:hypothetical protein
VYAASTNPTTCASSDGTQSTTQVTEVQWARKNARLAAMRSYWTGEHEPTYAPGKIDRAALYRRGIMLGALSGDAAIAGGLLTGTTGGLLFPERAMTSVDSLSGVIRASMPATPASRGLMQIKASGDANNAVTFGIDSSGRLFVTVNNSSGSADHTLLYTPDADQLAGTHAFGWRRHGDFSYLYLDGVEVAQVENAAARHASDTLALLIGGDGTNNLETSGSCSHAYIGTGAAAPPSLPLAQSQWEDQFELTEKSSQTLKWGGTAAGTPTRDAAGKIIGPRSMIGAHIGDREAAVGVM